MSHNTFGHLFRVTTFGESHGPAIGCVIDGCPPGLAIAPGDFDADLGRRATGRSRHTSQRREADQVEILSGVFDGRTTGTPIALLVRNTDARSKDYDDLATVFRPGHADFTYQAKYGIRDHRGGGRASARETTMRVAAGVLAKRLLAERFGTVVRGHVAQIGGATGALRCRRGRGQSVLLAGFRHGAGAGGLHGRPAQVRRLHRRPRRGGRRPGAAGPGAPLYGKLDAELAAALMSINAVKGVEIGDGFAVVAQKGSGHRDAIHPGGFASNHAGGILGGISSGQAVTCAIALKPTSSLRLPVASIGADGQPVTVEVKGRHDPCVGIRAVPIAEAMVALVLADQYLRHRGQCGEPAMEHPDR